ncbi:MAG TPA: Wzz/FepE/Etk N-terminal domain-containing protein [Candidatus Acidoferrum sp.]|nr:Wzz/FepE/Etk N-terminal domain-containing protein [Candidatus Acidoferrum sp.]
MFAKNENGNEMEVQQGASLRELLAIGFRQRRLIIGTFLGIFCLGSCLAFLLPKEYVSEMKILVKHERADPMVTPGASTPAQFQTDVSTAELQSEAELLKARDLLSQVVVACNLQNSKSGSGWHLFPSNRKDAVPRAVLQLDKNLTVEPVKLTNLISVSYKARDPHMAEKVLQTLANLYIEKHLEINHVPGEFAFFHQQAEAFRQQLADSEKQLTAFNRETGVVDPALQQEMTVRKLVDLEAQSKQDRASIAASRQRILSIQAQLRALPKRQITQVRTSDNPQLMERLKSTLLDLELKRTDLLAKYDPSYRPVKEVEAQIADARAALADAEKAPLRDETTDSDPTYQKLEAELASTKADLAATEAQTAATTALVQNYRDQSQTLNAQQVLHEDMLRKAKAEEEDLLLYSRRQEEARISDALDRERISNVVVAVPATVPFKAQSRWALIVLLSALLACIVSVLVGFVVDYWDPSFRTTQEIESFLGSPVVAAFPGSGD